jgi:hypothetical protein
VADPPAAVVSVGAAGGALGAAADAGGCVLGAAVGGADALEEPAQAPIPRAPAARRTATNRPAITCAVGRAPGDWLVILLNLV